MTHLEAGVAVSSTPVATTAQLDLTGVLGKRMFALDSAAARICRKGGTNIFVRNVDITTPNTLDSRRLEVVAEGLPPFGGAQLAVDTTLSALHGKRIPTSSSCGADGVVL